MIFYSSVTLGQYQQVPAAPPKLTVESVTVASASARSPSGETQSLCPTDKRHFPSERSAHMLYTIATASLLAFSPQAGVPSRAAVARHQLDVQMMARTPLIAGNWKVINNAVFFLCGQSVFTMQLLARALCCSGCPAWLDACACLA